MSKSKKKTQMIKDYTALGLSIAVLGLFVVLAILEERSATSSR